MQKTGRGPQQRGGDPIAPILAHWSEGGPSGADGITLREWFAGHALNGLLAAFAAGDIALPAAEVAARVAVEYADALLVALAAVSRTAPAATPAATPAANQKAKGATDGQ